MLTAAPDSKSSEMKESAKPPAGAGQKIFNFQTLLQWSTLRDGLGKKQAWGADGIKMILFI